MIALPPEIVFDEDLFFYVVDRSVERGPIDLAIAGPFEDCGEANAAKRSWRARGCRGAMVLIASPEDVELAPGGIQ